MLVLAEAKRRKRQELDRVGNRFTRGLKFSDCNTLYLLAGIAWVAVAFLVIFNPSAQWTLKTLRSFSIFLALGSVCLISIFVLVLPVERLFREQKAGFLVWQYMAGQDVWRLLFGKGVSLLMNPLLFLLFPAVISVFTWKWQGGMASAPILIFSLYLLQAFFFIYLGIISYCLFGSWLGKMGLPFLFAAIQLGGVFLIASLIRALPYLASVLNLALWVNPLFWLSDLYQFDLVRWNFIYRYSSLGGYRFSYPPLSFILGFVFSSLGLSFPILWLASKRLNFS